MPAGTLRIRDAAKREASLLASFVSLIFTRPSTGALWRSSQLEA